MIWTTGRRRMPAGFELVREGQTLAVADSTLLPGLRRAGLLSPGGVEAALQRARASAGRAPTARIPLPGCPERIVLRPVLHGGWLGPWLGSAMLGPGRPLGELEVTASLFGAGAPVPRPALVWARRRWGPIWHGVLGTVEIEDAVDGVAFLAAQPGRGRLHRTARLAGTAVRRFHDAGGVHPDLHVKNLLLRDDPTRPQVFVIDLDRARRVEHVSPARRMRELMRLYRSLRKRILLDVADTRACVAFFHAYVSRDRALRRMLLARLARERLRVAVHALRYRGAWP